MLRSLAFALAAFIAAPAVSSDTPSNFVEWRPGLASSAQPSSEWLARVKELGYDLVINLAPPQSHGSIANEGGIVGAKGVKYVNIPVDFSNPTAEDFRFFSEVVRANSGRRILVHCQINMRGASFAFLQRVVHENAGVPEALEKLLGIWKPDPVWKQFIEDTAAKHGKRVEIL